MLLNSVRLLATPWTVAHQAPLSMELSRQEYWSGLSCPIPRDLPDPGIKSGLLYCRQIHYCLNHQGSPSPNILELKDTVYLNNFKANENVFSFPKMWNQLILIINTPTNCQLTRYSLKTSLYYFKTDMSVLNDGK